MNINEISKKTWEVIKSHKRYVFIVAILLVFVVRGCSSSTTTSTTTTQTYTIMSGSIENTLKLIGTTKITNMQTLVFGAEGKVKAIYVKEGDRVKAGQLLAEIDKKSLSISLSQQALSIQNARINYDKLIHQYTDADIINAQKNVTDTQSKMNIAKKELVTLQDAQGTTVQISSPKIQSILLNTMTAINDGKDILDSVDEIFYITKTNSRYMDVQIYISAKNSSYKYSTESNYYTSKTKLASLENAYTSIAGQSSASMTSIHDLQQKTKDSLDSLSIVADSAYNAVNNSVDGSSLSLNTIDSRSSTLNSARSKASSRLSTLNNDISSLQNTSNDIASKQNEIKNDEAQLAVYKQTLLDMENGPKSNDRTLQLNSIKQSQLSYQQTSQQLDNYQIIAPFDGTVDAIGFKIGDTVSYNAGSSANGITVSNPDAYEVNTLIDQIDVVKVMPGQPVEITFDAYPGYSITGTIASIDPTPVTSAGVVSYKAKINLKQITGKKIYDSMSANVNVIVDHKDNILLIPTIAIQTSGDNTFVWTQQGTKDISLGITDGTQTEILSGLHVGDIVSAQAYQVQSPAKSTTFQPGSSGTPGASAQQTQQSFRMLQGGGSRPGN